MALDPDHFAAYISRKEMEMGLQFEQLLRATGRATQSFEVEVVRELVEEDLVGMGEEEGIKPPPLQRLTERHHALARTLAGGTPPGTAAVICGYVNSTVSILLMDPTFKELVRFYEEQVDMEYLEFHAQMAGLTLDAVAELRRRVEDNPEGLGLSALLEIVKAGADRTGHGPSTTNTQVNINVDLASRMEKARRQAREARMIDVTPREAAE